MELTSHLAIPELTALAKRTDDFTALVARQSRFVFRVAYSVLRNAQDAEDVVQDTFFKLHRSGAWQQMQDERAFLARAAWRLAVDRIAKPRLVPRAKSVPSHEQSVIDQDLQATVHRLIDALPAELRQHGCQRSGLVTWRVCLLCQPFLQPRRVLKPRPSCPCQRLLTPKPSHPSPTSSLSWRAAWRPTLKTPR